MAAKRPPVTKFRYNAAMAVAGAVAALGAVPVAVSHWWLSPIELIPLAVLVGGWRSGVNVTADHVVVRWILGGRRIRRAAITGFAVTGRRVRAVLSDDHAGNRLVWLPAVRPADVPALARAAGLHLATDRPAEKPAEPAEPADKSDDRDSADHAAESEDSARPAG